MAVASVKTARPMKFGSSVKKPTASAKAPESVEEAPAPTKVASGAKNGAPKAKGGRTMPPREKAFSDDMKIKCLVKENPFRSTLAERFDVILGSKTQLTVAEYVEATERYPDLGFFVGKGVIEVK